MRFVFAVALLVGQQLGPVSQGGAPFEALGARNIAVEFHLPPVHDGPADPLYRSAGKLQVLSRASRSGLGPGSAAEAWGQAGLEYRRAMSESVTLDEPAAIFRGTRASELNRLMSRPGRCAVKVVSPTLILDTPIYPRDHCRLELGRTRLIGVGMQPHQVQIKGRTDVRLEGGQFEGGQWGVSVARSHDVVVEGVVMRSMGGGGVMVTNSYGVTVTRNHFSRLGGAGVMLHGDTQHAVVAENELEGNTGWSNWHAGIVVTDRLADPGDDATTLLRSDGFLVKQTRITDRLVLPHDNLIVRNRIHGNKTSGIYSDGGARNVFVENTIESNAKEGMCLDNGSTANVVAENLFRGNGKRWGMSDAELKRDFVWSLGRLPDGTSAAKLPGISMDNSAYNQVVFNEVEGNSGRGSKWYGRRISISLG